MLTIEASHVSLAYRLDSHDTIHSMAVRGLTGRAPQAEFWALDDVSFTVSEGTVLGVIGPNGSGKSSLLKIIARILPPARGRVMVRGRILPLIELGAGFHPDLTGRENVVLYGTLLGEDPGEMRARASSIGEWAGVSRFLEMPIRSYSSGMKARLGFAVAQAIQCDVLLLDEVLSVGDQEFRERSYGRVLEMMGAGTSVVLVSHDLPRLKQTAHQTLWLDGGRLVRLAETTSVVDEYKESTQMARPAIG